MTGNILANKMREFFTRYVVLGNAHAEVAVTLWGLHTWVLECYDVTPRLAFISVERSSGKTRALEILKELTYDGNLMVHFSNSWLFRSINVPDGERVPTMLLDEADNFFMGKLNDMKSDILAFINVGYKRGGMVGRTTVGNKNEMRAEKFASFCPLALGSIHNLPDTLQSRSVVIPMKRKRKSDTIAPYRERLTRAEALTLREECAAWAEDTIPMLKLNPFPKQLPDGIDDRPAELWETLIGVADAIGGEWPTLARDAAVHFVKAAEDKPLSTGERLLTDIHKIFGSREAITTHALLDELHDLEGSTWGQFGYSRTPIDARALARILRDYDVPTGNTIRIGGSEPVKGYLRVYFTDAWERYTPHLLEAETPETNCSANSETLPI
jgi:hypothetical protein